MMGLRTLLATAAFALLTGCTTVLYEGKPVGTPDPGAFWRVIAEHGIKTLFTAPTAFRAIKKEDPKGTFLADHDLTHFEQLFLAAQVVQPPFLVAALAPEALQPQHLPVLFVQ